VTVASSAFPSLLIFQRSTTCKSLVCGVVKIIHEAVGMLNETDGVDDKLAVLCSGRRIRRNQEGLGILTGVRG